MRGSDQRSGTLFSYVDLEARVRPDHPLRTIRQLTDVALAALSGDFTALYAARMGRPSIPPEMLLRAMLLQAFYSISRDLQAARASSSLRRMCLAHPDPPRRRIDLKSRAIYLGSQRDIVRRL